MFDLDLIVELGTTTNNGEDTGNAADWKIGNAYLYNVFGEGWFPTSTDKSIRIAIKGSAATGTPTPTLDSADASLSGLVLNDGANDVALTPTFVSDTYAYTASVANGVTAVTVSGMANHSAATVAYSGTDANTGTDGHQVSLDVGSNEITVTVSAEDGTTTKTYTVTVRAQNHPRRPGRWRT